jgi:hypothetical protein
MYGECTRKSKNFPTHSQGLALRVSVMLRKFVANPPGQTDHGEMSIGYEDTTVSYVRAGRARLDETVTFVAGA